MELEECYTTSIDMGTIGNMPLSEEYYDVENSLSPTPTIIFLAMSLKDLTWKISDMISRL